MGRPSRVVLAVLVGLVTLAYAWWATSLRPFTGAALAATSAAAAGAIAVGASLRPVAAPARGHGQRGATVWVAILVVVAAWELASFVQHPRSQHPTLSSLADVALRVHVARAVALAAWLVVGVRVVRR